MPGNRAQSETLSHRLPAAATHQHNPISNRKRKLLEFALSNRKHRTSLFLIDNFGASLSRRPPWRASAPGTSAEVRRTKADPSALIYPEARRATRHSLALSTAEGPLLSNRESKLLETLVSHRKQTTAPRSNREEFHFFHPPILSVDPARPNSRDYPLAISLHRGKRP
jgi:hypothetical protein